MKKANTAMTCLTAEISAMEMLKAQLEAIVDNSERTELKQAYFEQVCKLQTNLEESKNKYVLYIQSFLEREVTCHQTNWK